MLLGEYKGQDVSGWLASEKLDGIRAYWDGKKLLSRSGKIIAAPSEFTAKFPPFELDGELYSKRGDFQRIQSIVMDKTPNIQAWKEIKFYIFDVPKQSGGLLVRLEKIKDFLKQKPNENIKVIQQKYIKDKDELLLFHDYIVKIGGEGVVVREPNVDYIVGRNDLNLKFKNFKDDECLVVGINQGKGKNSDKMGSITCQKDEKLFKIGSGFSDEDRHNPPKIGEIITYKYQNLTKKGLPRFPIFLRVRKE
ncbi:MAG: DNA ligase [Campylobacter sp.]|nr:DNA ligase [Campylobacter sp.]